MVKMSLGLELKIFAERVPFMAERHRNKWPRIGEGQEKLADNWDTLALLVGWYGDGTRRKVTRAKRNTHNRDIIRVEVFYSRGDWANDYDFLIAPGVIDELVRKGYLEGKPYMGFTDHDELLLTKRGERALLEHLKELYPQKPVSE